MIIFYDGDCSLCNTEMQQLKQADTHNLITLEDINAADFETRFSYIKRADALAFLHGKHDNGEMIYGLDVTFAAWEIVGKHSWLKIFKLPGIRFVADLIYWVFARYRKPLSTYYKKITNKTRCTRCEK